MIQEFQGKYRRSQCRVKGFQKAEGTLFGASSGEF